jgi:concentrative nucleoside transporter, CNT family
LVIKPFLEKMTRSELMAIMVGGFANTAGGVLGAYVLMLSGYFPNIAAHLISASVLSAPAAFIMAKVMLPEREEPLTMGDVRSDIVIEDANVLDAAANGATVGWQLAVNVGAMLIAFIALIAMANLGVRWVGGFFHDASGLLRFNVVVAALLSTLILTKHMPLRDTSVWWMLCAVGLIYLGARAILPSASATTIGLVGFISWFSLFLQMDRKRPVNAWIPMALLGFAVIANLTYAVFGPLMATTNLSLQLILGWMHWPVAFFMGTPIKDCLMVGRLLGEKLVLTEFVAYADLSGYLGSISRGEAAPMDARSIVLVSYALSGFSNFASIAIQIGGIAPLAPSRRQDIARLGLKAMVGGALASYALACVAGTFYTGSSMLGSR